MADKFTPSIRLAPLMRTRTQKTVNISAKKSIFKKELNIWILTSFIRILKILSNIPIIKIWDRILNIGLKFLEKTFKIKFLFFFSWLNKITSIKI